MLGLAGFALSPDVTPDAVNWANISGTSPQTNTELTMSGFAGTLTLLATVSGFSSVGVGARTLRIRKNANTSSDSVTPSNGATVTMNVVPGDGIDFQATQGTAANSWAATITVTSGGVTLDTFTVSVST